KGAISQTIDDIDRTQNPCAIRQSVDACCKSLLGGNGDDEAIEIVPCADSVGERVETIGVKVNRDHDQIFFMGIEILVEVLWRLHLCDRSADDCYDPCGAIDHVQL